MTFVGLCSVFMAPSSNLGASKFTPLLFVFFVLPVSCPPEWIKIGSSCFVYRSGVRAIAKAVEYCKVRFHGKIRG